MTSILVWKHGRRVLAAALGMCGLLLAGTVQADFYVAQNGQPEIPPYTSWGGAASNIQDAVNAADLGAAGATVWVGKGHYFAPTNGVVYAGITNVVYLHKPLTLQSSNGIPASVIIDGLGTNRGVQVYYSGSSTSGRFILNGLTVSNSYNHGVLYRNQPAVDGRSPGPGRFPAHRPDTQQGRHGLLRISLPGLAHLHTLTRR